MWTFKTLRFGADGAAEWTTAKFQFPVAAMAAAAAQAYMIAHAERGEMVVVSLEPSPELKPVMDRLAEHGEMLAELKRIHALTKRDDLATLIYDIEPEWQQPKETR